MHSRNNGVLARAGVLAIAAVAVLIAFSSSPAMAAHHDDYKGWFVSLDAAMTQLNSLDQGSPTSSNPLTSRYRLTTRQGDGQRLRFHLGGEGRPLGRSWAGWRCRTGRSTTRTRSAPPRAPATSTDGVRRRSYNNGGTYALVGPVDYKASAKTKASTIDLDYSRPMHAGEDDGRLDRRTALATFAGDPDVRQRSDAGALHQPDAPHMKSDAFGVKVGARVNFGMTQHFSCEGLMAWSFMQANTDGEATQNAGGTLDQITSSDDHVMGEIRDYDVRAVWNWSALDFYVGYGGQTWEGLVSDPIDGSCCGASGAGHSTRDSVAFNSAHAGVTFRFGGKH
jgi:hypothetical protein